MKKKLLIHAAYWSITALALGVSVSTAAEFPYPTVAFSADMTMNIKAADGGRHYEIQGKVYSCEGKERQEVSSLGRTTAIIKDRNKNETLTLMPDQKMYMRDQGSKAHKDPESMIRDGELKMTEQGSEKINGQTTTKYKIESTQQGKESFSGYAWFSKQNIPIRFKGTAAGDGMRQEVEINYTNVVIAKQDPKLFTVPEDYRPIPTGMGGMGTGAKGISPEQMEQLKEMMKKQKQP